MDRNPMEQALSTDVVMDIILSHLKARDLLSCRLASKFWNKAASSVMRRTSTMIRHISEEKDLMKLQKCMDQSLNFPFAGLQLDEPWKFKSSCAMIFFENYGKRFTRLCLEHCWAEKLHDLAPFIEHLPRLSILEISQPYTDPQPFVKESDSTGRQESVDILSLPSLRTIKLSCPCPEVIENVLREVLAAAASPSLRIECLDAKPEILRVLKGGGRLRSLSVIRIDEDSGNQEFALEMDRLLSMEQPSLTKLHFSSHGCVGLKKMLYSSQHTLRELHLDGMCLSEYWNKYPALPKLTKLSVHLEREFWSFLYHCRHGKSFPALKEVYLGGLHEIVPSGLNDVVFKFIVPSVTTIELEGYVNEFGMKQLAQSFPNVSEVRLNHTYYSGVYFPLINESEIWNVGEFKCLEKLVIWNYMVRRPWKDCINIDSFLTGIPVEMCDNLRKQMQQDLKNSPETVALRCNPSIRKLENLKELFVKPLFGWKQLPEDTPFISMVSVKYALEMMPNLRTKFVYQNSWPPSWWSFKSEERDVAALEDVFKDVQPYVKLERFFY